MVVAYVTGLILLLALFLLAQSVSLFSPGVQAGIVIISPIHHYNNLIRGVIAIDDVAFLLLLASLFLLLTAYQLERNRWA